MSPIQFIRRCKQGLFEKTKRMYLRLGRFNTSQVLKSSAPPSAVNQLFLDDQREHFMMLKQKSGPLSKTYTGFH